MNRSDADAPSDPVLTSAQRRILNEVRTDGPKVYNARARSPIAHLEALGLVAVDWDADLVTKGNGLEMRWRIKVEALPEWHEVALCRQCGGPLSQARAALGLTLCSGACHRAASRDGVV